MSEKQKHECAKYKTEQSYKFLLKKAATLTQYEIGETDQINRHLQTIDDFLASSCKCFWVQDLPDIIRLLYHVFQKSFDSEQYVPYFYKLFDRYCTPPMFSKTSDIMEYEIDVSEYLSMFGYMIVSTSNKKVLKVLCNGVSRVFNFKGGPQQCISNRVLNEILMRSELPVLIADYMHMVDTKIYVVLLTILDNLTQAEETCRTFIKKGIINLIVHHLLLPGCETVSKVDLYDYKIPIHFNLSLTVLWRLLQVHNISPKKFQAEVGYGVTVDGWLKCNVLFKQLVLAKHFKKERNALYRLLMIMASVIPVEQCRTFQYDIIALAGATENGTAGTWASDVVFRNDLEDFEFKVLSLAHLCFTRAYPTSEEIFHLKNTLLALLRILTPEIELIWTHGQRIKLMKFALISMERIIPFILQDFLNYNTPRRLLRLCEDIMMGNLPQSFLAPCLKCIYTSLTEGTRLGIPKKYRSKGTYDLFLSYVKLLVRKSLLTRRDQNNLIYIFCILQIINKRYNCSKENAMTLCIECMQRYNTPLKEDCFLDPRVLIAALDFLWENITWSEESRMFFIQNQGVFVLLDILEIFPIAVKLVGLNLLIHLAEEENIFPLLATWRGRSGQTIINLLLYIFRLSHETGQDRSWLDDDTPLMGTLQHRLTMERHDPNSSPSCLDMLCSTRPKAYALFQIIQCSPTKHALRDHYSVYNSKLNEVDELTLCVMENYLRMKMLEGWIEVKDSLERSGIRMLSFDHATLMFHIHRGNKFQETLKKTQLAIVRRFSEQEALEEKALYRNLRDQTLQDALSTIDEMKMSANTMNPTFRKRAKQIQRQQLQVEKSTECGELLSFHTTYMHNLEVTHTFEQKVSIRSNIVITPNKPQDIPPVSPCESIENRLSLMMPNITHSGVSSFETLSTESPT